MIQDELSKQRGFALNRLDRQAIQRADDAVMARHLQHPGARFMLIAQDRVLVRIGETTSTLFEHAHCRHWTDEAAEPIFLGMHEDTPHFAISACAEPDLPDDIKAVDLRSLAIQDVLAPGELGALAQARSMLHWHATHRYCSRCGHESRSSQGGYRRDCTNCGALHFPRTDPVSIMLIIRGDRCLLGRGWRFEQPMYSTLAGFIEPGETIEDAVRRETLEESGIRVGKVRYLSSQPWPFPASLMIGCIGEAISEDITIDTEELMDARWFDREQVVQMMHGEHPEGLLTPGRISIAYQLIKAWIDGEAVI